MRPRTFLRQRNLSSQRGKKSFFSSPYPRHNFWCVHVMRLSNSLLLSFILCASYFFLLRLLCLHFSFFCAGTCLEQWRLWCSCCLRRTSVTLCATSSSSNSATDRPSSPRATSTHRDRDKRVPSELRVASSCCDRVPSEPRVAQAAKGRVPSERGKNSGLARNSEDSLGPH